MQAAGQGKRRQPTWRTEGLPESRHLQMAGSRAGAAGTRSVPVQASMLFSTDRACIGQSNGSTMTKGGAGAARRVQGGVRA